MNETPELLVTEGPFTGRRFAILPTGVRLGRSSSCEISIKDPALSRNHLLVEVRDGTLWVTDLASANGTFVNGKALGADSRALAVGDRISAGASSLVVVSPASPAPSGEATPAAPPPVPAALDLGLGASKEESAGLDAPSDGTKPAPARFILWAVAFLAVGGAAWLILKGDLPAPVAPEAAAPEVQVKPVETEAARSAADNSGTLVAVSFEKVQASAKGVYRLAVDYAADGTLRATLDDIPAANRHFAREATLAEGARERLARIFAGAELYHLAPELVVPPHLPGELSLTQLRVVRSTCVFNTRVENAPEPETLREVREQFEAFVKNELGIWGVDKPVEELLALSEAAVRAGNASWEERDVRHGNLARAIRSYEEAVSLLATVDPKPAEYASLMARLRMARAELDARYREQCFRADRAINLKDWTAALAELRILREMVPSEDDPRHAEATAKLLDVEARQKEEK